MMANQTDIYLQDANGDKICSGKTEHMGETIMHPPEFPSISETINSLRNYKEREDDMWLLTYSKSDMMANQTDIYLQDANGDKICSGKTEHMGETIMHPPEFPSIAETINSLRNYKEREDDMWLLTYSKSGTHWLYEIIGILQSGEEKPLKEFKHGMMIETIPDIAELDESPSPRILNTHMRMKYIRKIIDGKNKIVCVVRNPKSVAVSFYFHTKGMHCYQYEGKFTGYLPMFMEGYYNLYGTWFEYVFETWDTLKDRDNVHFVYYEELKKNPVDVIEGLAKFLDLKRSREFCESVARLSSIQKMAKAEGKGKSADHLTALFKKGHSGIIRKGIVDDWKNHFTVTQNEYFDKIYQEKMKKYPELASRIVFE